MPRVRPLACLTADMADERPRFTLKQTVRACDPKVAVDFLAQHAGLSKSAVKDAMNKGAAWRVRKGARRARRAGTPRRGDRRALHYDPPLLALSAPPGRCLLNTAHLQPVVQNPAACWPRASHRFLNRGGGHVTCLNRRYPLGLPGGKTQTTDPAIPEEPA